MWCRFGLFPVLPLALTAPDKPGAASDFCPAQENSAQNACEDGVTTFAWPAFINPHPIGGGVNAACQPGPIRKWRRQILSIDAFQFCQPIECLSTVDQSCLHLPQESKVRVVVAVLIDSSALLDDFFSSLPVILS
jgi:hypothetical protein